VLLVVTILTILVLEFQFNTRVTARISSNVADDLKAYYLAKSGVHIAAKVLVDDAQNSRDDDLNEDWAQDLPPIPAGDGYVMAKITDENGKINVNRIARRGGAPDTRMQRELEQLFTVQGLDPNLAAAIIDWTDEDQSNLLTGTPEDSSYGYDSTDLPYPSKDAPLDTIAELNLVAGITPEVYKTIAPFVSIHADRRINVNTADATVLKAAILSIDPTADENIASQLVEKRQEEPFTRSSLYRVLQNEMSLPRALASRLRMYLITSTQTFQVVSTATAGEATKTVTAIVQRSGEKYTILYWRED
jgi:general secretion pathway protein K